VKLKQQQSHVSRKLLAAEEDHQTARKSLEEHAKRIQEMVLKIRLVCFLQRFLGNLTYDFQGSRICRIGAAKDDRRGIATN